ncbi:hypothetical protein FMM74_020105 [Lachnospiraceae bacterium MD308]|nr:hypothetical protein [Lachnospiraceae bacterium MD308]
MDVDIGIRKDLQPQYTGEEIAVFLILNYLQNDKNENLFISVDAIGYFLTGKFIDSQIDKNLIKGIKKGFEGLKKEEDVSILDQNRNNYIINSKSCRVDTKKNNFIIVHLWEIQKIFSSLGAYGFNVLRFFVNIIGTINGNSKSWHMTQDDMVLSWGFSKNTVNEYLCKLEELKLLYTFRSKARKADETFHRVGNVYGRYNDKELVRQEGVQYLSTVPNHPIQKHFYPRTSTKLKYNNFLKGSKKYDDRKEVEDLFLACVGYNDSFKDFPNDNIDYLDLSVFKKYGFNIPIYESKKSNNNKFTSDDDWGEPNSMETEDNNFTIEEILDMPIQSDLILENKTSNVDTIPMNPVKIITIKKKEQNREIPLEVKIQQYADDLYEQYGYGTEYEKSIFIVELAEKFPGLDDYEKYYNNAKKLYDLSV